MNTVVIQSSLADCGTQARNLILVQKHTFSPAVLREAIRDYHKCNVGAVFPGFPSGLAILNGIQRMTTKVDNFNGATFVTPIHQYSHKTKSMDMNYKTLALTLIISFIIMYAVMFLNVDDTRRIYLSTTRLYMAVLMVAPMAILMLITMGKMYPNKKVNVAIMISSAAVFIAALIFLRSQTFISDKAYMNAMIPHHSSAILTSKHANIKDPEVRQLADQIIKSQLQEIAQMKRILARLDNQ